MSKSIKFNVYLDSAGVMHNREELSKILDKVQIISNNAGSHNGIFRGKDITSYLDDGSLWTRISSGTFDDLFIGDYFLKGNIKYRVAGFDYYLHKGRSNLTKHHIAIVPDTNMTSAYINEGNDTQGGYNSCDILTTILPKILTTVEGVFGSAHIVEYETLLTDTVDEKLYNRFGKNTGATSNFKNVTRKIDLMSEVQVVGSVVWGSSGHDTGTMNTQLPLFKLAPEYICNKEWYWLRDVVSNSYFAVIRSDGGSDYSGLHYNRGVRPCFFIG